MYVSVMIFLGKKRHAVSIDISWVLIKYETSVDGGNFNKW